MGMIVPRRQLFAIAFGLILSDINLAELEMLEEA
jgi:hypothetical protein